MLVSPPVPHIQYQKKATLLASISLVYKKLWLFKMSAVLHFLRVIFLSYIAAPESLTPTQHNKLKECILTFVTLNFYVMISLPVFLDLSSQVLQYFVHAVCLSGRHVGGSD